MKSIVAVDNCWGIGKNNDMLFSIPEDMAFFKRETMGKVVVMGRNTLLSLPNGQPLRNRLNIILTRQADFSVPGAIICHSIEEVLERVAAFKSDDVFIIGGDMIYQQFLDYCQEALVTKIYANGDAERFFPNLDRLSHWQLVEESPVKSYGELQYTFCRYVNHQVLSPNNLNG